jgi:fermentation-respiration switch protein FrsA (DUF1100 family)
MAARLSGQVIRSSVDSRAGAPGESLFHNVVANIPGAIYRCAADGDRQVQLLSDGIEEICGYTADDFVRGGLSFPGLIVEDAYTSVADRGQEVFPYLPIKLIAASRFASIDKVGALRLPKLFLHARNDRTIPIEHGRRLFAAAAEPKQFVELDAGHGDAYSADRTTYYGAIDAFIRRVAAPAPVVAATSR